MHEGKCLNCGEPFKGRSDRKFCSDYCRNAYNNKWKSYSNAYVRKISYILKKNRKILSDLNPDGKSKVHKKQLLDLGFSFDYFTNIYQTKNGNTYYFVYEYGYLDLNNGYFALVKKNLKEETLQ